MSQKTFRLPDLGEGLTESEIVTWRVAEGDAVSVNQVLADVETGVIGAVHAGRPGMTGGIVTRALEVMAEAGAERIEAAVSHIPVPLQYSDRLYELRGAIDLVRSRISPA